VKVYPVVPIKKRVSVNCLWGNSADSGLS